MPRSIKYSIGQYIVEEEQQGNARAEYGKQVLKELSVRLTERFGDQQQWSVRQLSRQVGSSLYERLALSRNKDEVMRLAKVKKWIKEYKEENPDEDE